MYLTEAYRAIKKEGCILIPKQIIFFFYFFFGEEIPDA
jgi:hypothetical protein